jgi:hypothetical protein
MSWMANFMEASDIYLRVLAPTRPSVSLVDKDIFGDEKGLYHGHTLNGTKFWEGGAGRGSQRWYYHEKAPPSPNGAGDNGGGCGSCGCFTELQAGVAPTQSNVFTMQGGSTHEHTEFFKTLAKVPEDPLYSANYSEALGAVDTWLESADGVPRSTFEAMDAWMESVAERAPTAVLHEGGPGARSHCRPVPPLAHFIPDSLR